MKDTETNKVTDKDVKKGKSRTMATVRISQENHERLEMLAILETNRQRRIVTIGEVLNKLLDAELPKALKKLDQYKPPE